MTTCNSSPCPIILVYTQHKHDRGFHLASRFCLDPKVYKVVSPLVAPPWCRLVMPAGCHIASCRPLIEPPSHHLIVAAGCCIHCTALSLSCCASWLSHASHRPLVVTPTCQLITPACCCIASPCPLIVSRAVLSSSRCAGWLSRWLSTRRPLVVSSFRHVTLCCLVTPAGCRAIISCHPLVAPPSHPLIVLAGCCIAYPCTAILSSRCR